MSENQSENGEKSVVYDICQIQKILAHRYPFLLIDRVVELVPDQRIVAQKNVTVNEQFFVGHFPEKPVMPGVLILEAMAQAAALLAYSSPDGLEKGRLVYLVGATDVRWKRQVMPGDVMLIEMVSVKKRRPLWIMSGQVTVDGKVAAVATLSAAQTSE